MILSSIVLNNLRVMAASNTEKKTGVLLQSMTSYGLRPPAFVPTHWSRFLRRVPELRSPSSFIEAENLLTCLELTGGQHLH